MNNSFQNPNEAKKEKGLTDMIECRSTAVHEQSTPNGNSKPMTKAQQCGDGENYIFVQ